MIFSCLLLKFFHLHQASIIYSTISFPVMVLLCMVASNK